MQKFCQRKSDKKILNKKYCWSLITDEKLKKQRMKKLLIILVLSAISIGTFAQLPVKKDTTRKEKTKNTKKWPKKGRADTIKRDTIRRDTMRRDTMHHY
ncbi:hypothetical protein TH53_01950 [Pedobacter lusitanus]|uniref:Uncharacterized protein n=2 Tax=Pedobacter lusitanus TaxID=1503925 RepID=A0A0D0GW45_9SPHI|nr:hypothetical protein TH53_01950 [Pedobacter lusitanus]